MQAGCQLQRWKVISGSLGLCISSYSIWCSLSSGLSGRCVCYTASGNLITALLTPLFSNFRRSLKGIVKLERDSFEEFRDPETYDVEVEAYDEDRPLIEQWVRLLGGPLLHLACGTGRVALRLAAQGYQVTGVDIMPEMIARARQKAAERAVSVEWVVADARTFQLQRQFPFIFMVCNAFQFLLTREDLEALLARVQEHLLPEGCFLFETRNPCPRNLLEVLHPDPPKYPLPDGGQLVVREEQDYDPITQIQHYTRHLTFLHPGGQRVEKTLYTDLRYIYPQEMEALLFYNGFHIRACYGNWQQEPLTATSPAMIYVCQRR